ncbi:hypothetical protein [Pseudogemmobacter bohemicus]|uniref:hypothetical protein n=1 Tax=Pseudogemmobacter bohemicus TaxID=2250708 RepID=UPI000DD4C8D1|nr:hypothetical protein [Pseudogemmobacter bohemicus]
MQKFGRLRLDGFGNQLCRAFNPRFGHQKRQCRAPLIGLYKTPLRGGHTLVLDPGPCPCPVAKDPGKELAFGFDHPFAAGPGFDYSLQIPWLPNAHREACTHPAAVIQRGASNAWFPIVESAIDIPPFSEEFSHFIRQEQYWKAFRAVSDPAYIRGVIEDTGLDEEWTGPPMTRREMEAQIRRILERNQQGEGTDLRAEEYGRLVTPPGQGVTDRNFRIECETLPPGLEGFLGHLVRVERLREVRVLTGFTRLSARGQETQAREPAKLSAARKNWLPAVEVFGEGIFVALDLARLREWETRTPVRERVQELNAQLAHAAAQRGRHAGSALAAQRALCADPYALPCGDRPAGP